ncbi:ABC transporter permease [Acidobacteriota bacterium]
MFWNHLKTAIRILGKQKVTSAINIFGLGIGLAFFALLVAYIRDELTFDSFHKKVDQTYLLTSEFRDRFIGGVHHFIGEMLETEYPEVESGSTVRYAMHSQIVRRGDLLIEKDFAFTDPGFFKMFSFELIEGNPSSVLSQPHQIVICTATAETFFGKINAIGKTLSILIGDTYQDFTVSGIVRDVPGNSSLRFDGLLHYSQVFDAYQIDKNNNDFVTLPMFTTTFLDLPDENKVTSLRSKFPALNDRLYGAMWRRVKMDPPKQGFDLLRLSDYHLGDVDVFAFVSRGRPVFSWILSGIAFLVLMLACFNSVNLSLSQSSTRLKEIGVRKVIGAHKGQLVIQLLTESFLSGLISLLFGLMAAALLISPFNALTGKRLAEKILFHPQTLLIVLGSVVIVSLLIGLIPALSLSKCQTNDVFRGRFFSVKKHRLSFVFIVFQFTVSLFFVIGSLIMTRQLQFMTAMDLGYDPSNIILVHTQVPGERASEGKSLLEVFRNELSTDGRIIAVSADSGTVGSYAGSVTRRYDKEGLEHTAEAFLIDHEYMKVLDIPFVVGRDFSFERSSDLLEGILINESFVKDFGLKDPVGLRFSDFAIDKLPPEYTFDPIIIGVVKDFHIFSMHFPIGPMAFGPRGFPPIQRYRNILVKVGEGEEASVLKKLETIWAGVRPDLPFQSTYLDDALAWEYRRERDWGRIVGWSAGFALVIASLGLFGLAAVTVVRRTKETGIRKVLGANMTDILLLLSKDVLKWIIWANLISWPLAFLAGRKWLEGFAYRIDIDIWIFLLAGVLSLLIAGMTMGWHVVRAALSDPVQSLRYE